MDEEDTSTHKCTVDWGPVGGPDLKADGFTDIDADCGGTRRSVIGREEGTVYDMVCRNLDRRVGFECLGQTVSQHMSLKQGMKGECTASERRLALPGLPIAGPSKRVSPIDVESSDMLTAMRV